MPLACDPSQTFDTWLKSDADKPAATRPTFVFRYLTGREFRRVSDAMDNLHDAGSHAEAYDAVMGCITPHLVTWRNMPDRDKPGACVAFTKPEDIDTVLTQREMSELVFEMLRGARPSGDDLGKSEAQP